MPTPVDWTIGVGDEKRWNPLSVGQVLVGIVLYRAWHVK